ncbi:hypothetical protein PI125_g9760 [Phytophthora idaei]|nr:hypothetical protein PI125_g9760 [Phytophthora idaei]
MKPYNLGTYSLTIYWEPNYKFDEKFSLVKQRSGVQASEPGFGYPASLNYQSDIAFKVYHGESEVTSIDDYTCAYCRLVFRRLTSTRFLSMQMTRSASSTLVEGSYTCETASWACF